MYIYIYMYKHILSRTLLGSRAYGRVFPWPPVASRGVLRDMRLLDEEIVFLNETIMLLSPKIIFSK